MIYAIGNHLWQSTVFAVLACVLALSLRRYRAQTRHWIWLAASLKFLVPFALLTGLGSLLPVARVDPPARVTALVEEVSQPFAPMPSRDPLRPRDNRLEMALMAIWSVGSGIVLVGWWRRWRPVRRALQAASPLPLEAGIPVRTCRGMLEPGVFGIFRPVLLLPEGIADRLTSGQLKSVVAHELCHVRRRDNLTSAVHMLVEAAFWFHPAVWWIGSRLVDERERACDEEVLRSGSDPEVYAESILQVCRHYLESPLPCIAGVTGANLRTRIEQLMLHRLAPGLGPGKKIALAAMAAVLVAVPFFAGMSRAQRQPAAGKLEFEVASIKPNKSGVPQIRIQKGQGYLGTNVTLRNLIQFAYQTPPDGLAGLPGWTDGEHFDVAAKAPADATDEQRRQMMQALLADRCKLAVHQDTKEMPVYALVVAKGGPKLQPSKADSEFKGSRGVFVGTGVPMQMLAGQLRRLLGRPVNDETGLSGEYDFKLEWTPDEPAPAGSAEARTAPPDRTGPSIFTALQEQLGLRLESRKGVVVVLVVDGVERPSEN
jgi:bla regulator protein BlaR1